MATPTIEQAVVSEVTKIVFTPEKIKTLAAKTDAALTVAMEKKLVEAVEYYVDENLYDLLYDDDAFRNAIRDRLFQSLGITPQKATKRRR